MGAFFYSMFLLIYRLGLHLSAPFNQKARLFLAGRKNIWPEVETIAASGSQLIWVHCASLGEFEQGRPVIEGLREIFPDHKILLTFFSPSGYEVRKNYSGADHILYLPLDSKRHARRWVGRLKPNLAIFVKYEFWDHYLRALAHADIPLLSVASVFRPDQIYFKPWGGFQRQLLQRVYYYFVQDERSAKLLASIGIRQVEVAGDTRFDRVKAITSQPKDLPGIRKFCEGDTSTLVVGSAWQEDMEVLLPWINEVTFRIIIAPHEPEEKFIRQMEDQLKPPVIRFSKLTMANAGEFRIVIIDNIGLLSSLYAYGDYAWVGGAYGKGLHNILEPAAYGIPVFFGNKAYGKFREARELLEYGGAFAIPDTTGFKKKITHLAITENYENASRINRLYVEENTGATEQILNYCRKLLK